MVASGTEAVARTFGATAVLGRTITTPDGTHEIPDDRMSREHARVRFEGGHWVITDLESRNGTYVNAQRITGEMRRRGDTVLRCGHSVFVLLGDATGHPAPPVDDAVIGPELGRTYDLIRRAAGAATLLVHGEPGAGKEVAARLFHASGPRCGGPFVAVSCPSIPEGVAEKLLFGGRKGIFESIGHAQMARGGTLFLDEVAALGPAAQRRLLKWIEEGGDCAIVAGAHAELRVSVSSGEFDALLYKSLAKTMVHLPPLRDRKVDIARLVVREVAAVDPALRVHAKLVESCLVRPWPGNVRELQVALRKAATDTRTSRRDIVRIEDLDPAAGLVPGGLAVETAVERKRDTPPIDAIDKATVEAALVRANGVIHLAARVLGIHRSQLYQLMDRHGIVFTDEP
jgi:DNA-binding NtrC family response regulator